VQKYTSFAGKFILSIFTFVTLALQAASVIAAPVQKISLQLQWKHQFEFAGFYAAKEKGFYKDAGLEVDFYEYMPNTNITEEVLSGRKQFGTWDSQLIAERLKGNPIKLVANYFKRSPLVVLTSTDIRSPAELRGKTLIGPPKDFESAGIQAMFRQFGLSNENVTIVPSLSGVDDFIDGKANALTAFLTNELYSVREGGKSFNVLDPNNYGAEFYDLNLFTSDAYAKEYPETVEAFRDASNRGWAYALDHPDEIIDLILRKYDSQGKRRAKLQYEATETTKVMLPKVYPIGSIESDKLRRMAELFVQLGQANSLNPLLDFVFGATGDHSSLLESKIVLSADEKAYLSQHPVAHIVMVTENPPFSFDEGNGSVGFDHDLLRLLSSKTGLAFHKEYGAWESILEKFIKKDADIITDISFKKERENFTLFTKPYFEMPTAIYVRNDFKNYNGLQSLNGMKVGYTKGIYYENNLRALAGVTFVGFESSEEMVKALLYGKIDALINNLARINHIVTKNGYLNILLADELNLPDVGKEDLRFGVKNDEPLLRSILQKGLDAISNDERQALISHWLGVSTVRNAFKTIKIKLSDAEQSWVQAHPTILAGNEANYPPYDFSAGDQPRGFSIDLLNLLVERIGLQVKYVTETTWEPLLAMFKQGRLDLLHTLSQTPEREKIGKFTDIYIRTRPVYVTRAGEPDVSRIEQLRNKTVAVCKGWWAEEFLAKEYPEIKLLYVKNLEEMLNAVVTGKADILVEEEGSVRYWIRKNRLDNIKITGWATEFDRGNAEGFKFFVQHNAPELVSMLNKALASLTPDELDSLQARWFGTSTKALDDQPTPHVDLTPEEQAYLTQKKELKMCGIPDWMPFSHINAKGEYEGISADMIGLMQQRLGVRFVLTPTKTWGECLEAIKEHRCDITPIAEDLPDRRHSLNFTAPYLSQPLVIATESKELFVKDGSEIGNRKVGGIKDFAFLGQLRAKYPKIQIVEVENAKDGLDQVRNGDIWGYIDGMPSIGFCLQKDSMLDLKIAGRMDFDLDLSLASRNDEPLLAGIMQKAVDSITDEERRVIANKWISVKYEQGFDYALLWKMAVAATILLFGFFVWNRKLSKFNTAIRQSQRQVRTLLDNSGQGFLSCGLDLCVKPQYSAECKIIFSQDELAGVSLPDLLITALNAPKLAFITRNLKSVLGEEDSFKRDIYLSLLPSEYNFCDHQYAVEYKVVETVEDKKTFFKKKTNSHGYFIRELMFIFTDVTHQRELERAVQIEQQRLKFIVSIINCRNDFFSILDDFQAFLKEGLASIIEGSNSSMSALAVIYRHIHTYKGLFSQLEFPSLPLILHEIEQDLSDIRDNPDCEFADITDVISVGVCHKALEDDLAILRRALGREFLQNRSVLTIPQAKALELEFVAKHFLTQRDALLNPEERASLMDLRRIRFMNVSEFLRPYARLVEQIAKRLEKNIAPVSYEGDDPQLDPAPYENFFRSLVHVFRNAVVHGIESPEERMQFNKPEDATITCRLAVAETSFLLEIEDDGRGIDKECLRQKASTFGRVEFSSMDLDDPISLARLAALDGISSTKSVDQFSGRGVGLSSVMAEVTHIGGRMEISSILGHGTTFRFICPFIESIG
jgi:ABC-type amino acid transport substrate-binding protein/ABC-type nitrate/sulfonate/bicarbonate transport system substrate-binding protein